MTDKIPRIGSRAQVFHGHALATSGGLRKKDLMKKKGRIISRRKSAAGKKALKHLTSKGYIAKKGTFKLFRKSDVDGRKHRKTASKKHGKRHTRKRGGATAGVAELAGSKYSAPAK